MYDRIRSSTALLFLAIVAACSSGAKEEAAPGSEAGETPAANSASAPATQEMHADTLTPRLQAHMASVERAGPEDLKALLPEHRRLVTAMIEDCRKMMVDMNMQPPAKWTQLEQQLQQDLTRLEQAPPGQLASLMDEHRGRVREMMDMRHDMM